MKVTAVVPAFNEEARIGSVLRVLTSYSFDEIIVVDDGSTDGTSDVAKKFNVRLIREPENKGKGKAIDTGIKAASGDIIFCSDADVIGLNHRIIDQIINPVVCGEVDMFVGLQGRPWYSFKSVYVATPVLGGQRAFTRSLWEKVPAEYKDRFQIETALNFFALHEGKGLRYKPFKELRQKVKEEKYGLVDGLVSRIKMIGNIVWANVHLHGNSSVEGSYGRLSRSYDARQKSLDNYINGKS